MSAFPFRRYSLLTSALILASAGAAWSDDPPERVGRLSYIEGTVSLHSADEGQWTPAHLTYPVSTGDAFWTEPNARREIQVGSMEIRMDNATEIDVLRLDDQATQVQVPQGVINVHLRDTPPTPMQIITPQGEVDLDASGSYHIDSGRPTSGVPAAQALVTVLEGHAEIKGPRGLVEVIPGESAAISANPASVTLQEGNASAFDNWALSRERREVALQATQYVPPEMTGYEDLDNNGSWVNDPQYGAVWYPSAVADDWAPYRYGNWVYVNPWGWTWVDYAPWGFAPFHYGRWIHEQNHWGWVPGEIVHQPVYAPALVAFIGGTNKSVGWVPLGPSEPFHPSYHVSDHYVQEVNTPAMHGKSFNAKPGNVTVNNYANAKAATVVSAANFSRGAAVHKSMVAVPHEQLKRAPVVENVAHIAPVVTPHATAEAAAHRHAVQTPGPVIHRPMEVMHVQPQQEQVHNAPAPVVRAEVPHPVQQTHITPTPNGWVRAPQEQHAPAPTAKEAPHANTPERGNDQRNEQQR